jgi:hypothetical protein
MFTSRPDLTPRVQSVSTLSAAGKASGRCQNELLGSFISHQGGLFFPISSSQPLSGRIAHHPERIPCSLLFCASCPANSPRPAPHKPMRSSCAAKRPRRVPVDDGLRAVAAVAGAHPLPELIRTPPHGAAERQRMASIREQARRRRQLDTERGITATRRLMSK